MNCAEFQRVLPEFMEGHGNSEQEGHLISCSPCSNLFSDLKAISNAARLLQGSEEPSPRVWNSLEIAMRQEGLIRQPQSFSPLVSWRSRRWKVAWLAPAAAALVVTGFVLYYRNSVEQPTVAQRPTSTVTSARVTSASRGAAGGLEPRAGTEVAGDDQQLLEEIGSRSPDMRAEYATNLQTVNAYIRDAEESAKEDPNDEEAQNSVMNAYEQRAMVYQLAMDRSLP
jgi:hypothetical protein